MVNEGWKEYVNNKEDEDDSVDDDYVDEDVDYDE